MSDTITEVPLLTAVRDALSGVLDVRVFWHPARPGCVAVRGRFWDACVPILKAARFRVDREDGWLTVSTR